MDWRKIQIAVGHRWSIGFGCKQGILTENMDMSVQYKESVCQGTTGKRVTTVQEISQADFVEQKVQIAITDH